MATPTKMQIIPEPIKALASKIEATYEDIIRSHFSSESMTTAQIHDNSFLDLLLRNTSLESAQVKEGLRKFQENHKLAVICLGGGLKSCFSSLWSVADIRLAAANSVNSICAEKLKQSTDTGAKTSIEINDMEIVSPENKSKTAAGTQYQYPTHIVGDMEEIDSSMLEHCTKNNVSIIRDHDLSSTDLDKAINYLINAQESKHISMKLDHLIIYNVAEQRFDKILAGIHSLYRYSKYFKRMLLFSEGTLIELLTPGTHIIIPNNTMESISTHCGLLPIGEPVKHVFTTGLEYNLEGQSLKFGDLISAANLIVSKQVKIQCTEPLVWYSNFDLPGSKAHPKPTGGFESEKEKIMKSASNTTTTSTSTGTSAGVEPKAQ